MLGARCWQGLSCSPVRAYGVYFPVFPNGKGLSGLVITTILSLSIIDGGVSGGTSIPSGGETMT